jgi:hypothetical protein
MTDDGLLPANITVDQLQPGVDGELIAGTMRTLGISARVTVIPPRRGGDLQWLILAALPLQAFLSGIGGRFAEDAYTYLRDAARTLLHQEQPAARPMVLQDTASGLQIILEHDLPSKAYEQLLGLDLSSFRLGPVHYDRAEERWRSELNEATAVTRTPPR